jgi:thiosulfate/3-mercaptopyruvate sulfurtransferase
MQATLSGFLPRLAIAFGLFLALSASPPVTALAAAEAPPPLVSADWLAGERDRPDLVVLDMRGAEAFATAHIPGAVHSAYPGAWRTERDGVPWVLPAIPDLEAYLSSLGVGDDTTVVLVPEGKDSTEFGVASWPYWVLKYLGHDAVAILDGGWKAWRADAARPVENRAAEPQPATFTANPQPDILVSTKEVASKLGIAALVDARPRSQYSGESKSGFTVRAGRIPGAVNIPTATVFDADAGRLKSKEKLAAIVSPLLPDPDRETITYCNTGHWGSIDWFVLHELLGFSNVALYEESMAGWTRDASLPVETGPVVQ